MASSTIKRSMAEGLYGGTSRYFKCASVNYAASITITDIPIANSAGLIITGSGSSVGLFAFSVRPTDNALSVDKIGGNTAVTLTGTVTNDGSKGTIVFTPSSAQQMTVYYMSY